jgi:hypothetical protein
VNGNVSAPPTMDASREWAFLAFAPHSLESLKISKLKKCINIPNMNTNIKIIFKKIILLS